MQEMRLEECGCQDKVGFSRVPSPIRRRTSTRNALKTEGEQASQPFTQQVRQQENRQLNGDREVSLMPDMELVRRKMTSEAKMGNYFPSKLKFGGSIFGIYDRRQTSQGIAPNLLPEESNISSTLHLLENYLHSPEQFSSWEIVKGIPLERCTVTGFAQRLFNQ